MNGGPYLRGIPPEDRFEMQVQKTDSCWIWIGGFCWNKRGRTYGKLFVDGRSVQAHRYSYELYVGPIPPGLFLDHLCFNMACVNPAHLEPVTPAVNNQRLAAHHRKDACPQGHPWDEANTYWRYGRDRICRACARERYYRIERTPERLAREARWARERYARRKEAVG